MKRDLSALVLTAALTPGLAGCEGGGDPVEQALREVSAAHQAAATPTTVEIEGRPAAGDADQAYVRSAIEEHRAAIARAEASLRGSPDPVLRRLARSTIETRRAELAALEAWRPGATEGK